MKTYVVTYAIPLIARAWNAFRVEATSEKDAVLQCLLSFPGARIVRVQELVEEQ